MKNCRYAVSIAILSLIISPAAFAAAENPSMDKPAQTEPETKSYLPPWMQGQGGSGTAATPEKADGAPADKSVEASGQEPAGKTMRGGSQGQRSHRHRWPGEGLIGGLVGMFGR